MDGEGGGVGEKRWVGFEMGALHDDDVAVGCGAEASGADVHFELVEGGVEAEPGFGAVAAGVEGPPGEGFFLEGELSRGGLGRFGRLGGRF